MDKDRKIQRLEEENKELTEALRIQGKLLRKASLELLSKSGRVKPPTEEQIQELCNDIQELVDAGWSIVYARKEVLGADGKLWSRCVMASDRYLKILNDYAEKKGLRQRFDLHKGKLVGRLVKP